MPIKILSEDLINKIAAGEVIERPASVVKELVENSLDSGANKISIDISDSGKKMIKITDNGSGMSETDVKNSILRHATSKISNVDDLFAIQSFGFRGEALASIAAVSQLSIITKMQDQLEGFNLVVEAGNIISTGIIAAEQGTTVEVRNLFFNTPARKKFLKTDAVELRHIVDVITNYALINKNVSFKLTHENHQLLNSPGVEDQQANISSIYGLNIAKELIAVDFVNEFVQINGYIVKPYQARNDKNQQSLFVNNRWVRNKDVTQAIYDGYHSMLFVGKHPIFVLNIVVDPAKIDVNVHPQKLEIKIEQREQVCQAVTEAIRETLKKNNLIPLAEVEFESANFTPKKKKYNFDKSSQTVLKTEEKVVSEERPAPVVEKPIETDKEKLPELKLMGQVHKTFFVAETPGGVFFIDQHAAHERVLYERFMKQFMKKKVEVQNLLKGEIIEFSSADVVLLNEFKEELAGLGFNIEFFGGNSFIVKTIPLVFGRLQPKETIFNLLEMLNGGKNKLDQVREEIITRMACRSAVMAGDDLTLMEVSNIINELEKCDHPFTCPHGRPTMIKTDSHELEKKFRRCG